MDATRSKTGSKKLAGCTAIAFAAAVTGTAGATERPASVIRGLKAEADTYVSADRPQTNFGRLRSLRADGSPQATTYLRFRLKKVRGNITGVTLLLHARTGARTSFEVRRVRLDEWQERRLTFENAPRLSLRYASSKPVRRGAWSAVDVSSFVTGTTDTVSLAITTRNPLGVVFESRESNQGPRLVVRTADENDSAEASGL